MVFDGVVDVWEQDSPVGALTIAAHNGAVALVQFGAARRVKTSLGQLGGHGDARDDGVAAAFEQYFTGDPASLDTTPVDLRLVPSETHRTVLTTLRDRTEFGQTTTYGALAEWSGLPGAAQLVGQVMGANPIPIMIPCHRVVAADGSLGGFSGGLDTKRVLFRIEGIVARSGGWGHPGYDQPQLF